MFHLFFTPLIVKGGGHGNRLPTSYVPDHSYGSPDPPTTKLRGILWKIGSLNYFFLSGVFRAENMQHLALRNSPESISQKPTQYT